MTTTTATTTTTTTTLVLIDVQKDFHPGGSLAIPTANDDAKRIASLIADHGSKIDRIICTMDSHLKLHIAHAGFWYDGETNSKHPDVFTIISHQDVVDGKWKPRKDIVIPNDGTLLDPTVFEGANDLFVSSNDRDKATLDLDKYVLEYTKRLESSSNSKFKLCIWPDHCLIGSPGHALVDDVRLALDHWSETTGRSVEFVHKGQNILTESYSAMEAEVPVTKDTQFNQTVMDSLVPTNNGHDDDDDSRLLVCGQAMSHCVNFTLRSLITGAGAVWPKDKYSNITLLTDCASSVPGFEAAGEEFQKDMKELGVILATADQVFADA